MVTERFFEQRSALTDALSSEIVQRVRDGVAARGQASLVVTGGSTPGPLYDALGRADAPWAQTWLTLTDERWVSVDDPASNEGLVRRRLLQGRVAEARLVGLKTAADAPAEALEALEQDLAALPRPFDAVILGMGADGHIASLFPHAEELATALDTSRPDLAAAIERSGADGSSHRVSLTLRALLDARYIAILIEGEGKRDAYRRVQTETDTLAAPVRALLTQDHVPVDIWWAP